MSWQELKEKADQLSVNDRLALVSAMVQSLETSPTTETWQYVTVEPKDIEMIRAEALRKLGRNVVNFSKIEACLKFLISINNLAGTASNLSDRKRGEDERIRKQTLGKLVQEFNKNIIGSGTQSETPESLDELWLSVSINVSANCDRLKQKRQMLAALVAERNALIHHDLAELDRTSAESYRELIDRLDEQNPRLLQQLDELGGLITMFRSGCELFQAYFESPDFIRDIQPGSTDT